MSVSITTLPTFLLSGKRARITATATVGNRIKISCTAAPVGSALRADLDQDQRTRIEVAEIDSGKPFDLPLDKFDVAGIYRLHVEEIRHKTWTQGYDRQRPPAGYVEDAIVSTGQDQLFFAPRLTSPVGTQEHRGELVLYVDEDNQIAKTTVEMHGEATPAIVSSSPTTQFATVLEDPNVRAALTALVSQDVNTALGDTTAIVSDLVTKTRAHTALAAGIHDIGDADNRVPVQFASPMAPKDLPAYVSLHLQYMRRHHENQDASGVYAAGAYHKPSGTLKTDYANMPIIDAVGSLAEAYAALAELWRCHTGHVADIPSQWHGTPTSGYDPAFYTLNALPPLLEVHRRVFEVLASFSPDVPNTLSDGASMLINRAGFELG